LAVPRTPSSNTSNEPPFFRRRNRALKIISDRQKRRDEIHFLIARVHPPRDSNAALFHPFHAATLRAIARNAPALRRAFALPPALALQVVRRKRASLPTLPRPRGFRVALFFFAAGLYINVNAAAIRHAKFISSGRRFRALRIHFSPAALFPSYDPLFSSYEKIPLSFRLPASVHAAVATASFEKRISSPSAETRSV
jgi:hypothetical protein